MEAFSFSCSVCGATGFGNAGALGAHKKYLGCGSKRPRSPTIAPLHVNLDPPPPIFESPESPVDDFSFFQEDDSKVPYDSTFSLVHWIRTCRNNSGLSIRDINVLFNQVLFHPSFKLEDVSVRSSAEMDSYEGETLAAADGWKQELIQGHILHYRDPIDALGSLFSSPIVAEGFEIYPNSKNLPIYEKVYSTPGTANWWKQMQVSYKLMIFWYFARS